MIRKIVVLALVGLAVAAPSKVAPDLASTLKSEGSANIFVRFRGGNSAAIQQTQTFTFTTRGDKVIHLVSNLKAHAQKSQTNALSLLKGRSSNFKQIWVSNEIFVKGASAELVSQLESLPEVEKIRQELELFLEVPVSEIAPNAEWNVEKVEAEQAWALPGGNNGAGSVVANIDTGVRYTHEALRDNFRTPYGWYDPYSLTPQPTDENGHGTHVMGTIAGSGGIGIAPGAQWMACRGCSSVSCTEEALKECGQFVLCPTLADGTSEDCSKAPNVVSNSWGGGQNNDFYNDVIDAWKAANIVPVFAIGNSGPGCGTVNSPGDQAVIGVAATNSNDELSPSSSAGPALSGAIKPDICAPGSQVRSAWNTGDSAYNTISGTSMATPHVSGGAALLLSANPALTYDQVKGLLEANADTNLPDTGVICGGIPSTEFPNNQYGHGRLNVRRALQAALNP